MVAPPSWCCLGRRRSSRRACSSGMPVGGVVGRETVSGGSGNVYPTGRGGTGGSVLSARGFPQFPQNVSPSSNREPQLHAVIWFTYPPVVTGTPSSRRGKWMVDLLSGGRSNSGRSSGMHSAPCRSSWSRLSLNSDSRRTKLGILRTCGSSGGQLRTLSFRNGVDVRITKSCASRRTSIPRLSAHLSGRGLHDSHNPPLVTSLAQKRC